MCKVNQVVSVFRVKTVSCRGLEIPNKTIDELQFEATKRQSEDATVVTEA